MTTIEYIIAGPVGQELGRFSLSSEAKCADLQELIHVQLGPPPGSQQLLLGPRLLKPHDLLATAATTADSAAVEVTLLLKVPEGKKLAIDWKAVPDTSDYLEELTIKDEANLIVPRRDITNVGLDPDTGLLLVIHPESDAILDDIPPEHSFAKNHREALKKEAKGGGYLPEEVKDLDGEKGKPFTKGGKGKGKEDDSDLGGEKGTDKGGIGKGKGKGKGKGRGKTIQEEASVLVHPSDQNPFEVSLSRGHPLKYALDVQVVQRLQSFPVPSMGVCVALATVNLHDLLSSMRLVCCELCGALITWKRLSDGHCEAFCLDRTNFKVISVQWKVSGRMVVFQNLRGADEPVEEFFLEGEKRATSIAYVEASTAVLLTFAGDHAIFIYKKDPAWRCVGHLGDVRKRGCADGQVKDLRFWFPSSDFSDDITDSRPLILGAEGRVYIHSGGALMSLAGDLSSARKISSMREELWLVDPDEGTPQYPTSFHVFGVGIDGKVYRCMRRNDYTGLVFIRRLRISDDLRHTRNTIRQVAGALWPKINHDRVVEHWYSDRSREYQLIFPHHYAEKDRDKWDGKRTWLTDPWIWQNVQGERPNELRSWNGRDFEVFEDFMCDFQFDHWYSACDEWHSENTALTERRGQLPAEVELSCHQHPLKSQDTRMSGYFCDVCQTNEQKFFFGFEDWAYVCQGCSFYCHPFCAVVEEGRRRKELEERWQAEGRTAFEEIPVVLDMSSLERDRDD